MGSPQIVWHLPDTLPQSDQMMFATSRLHWLSDFAVRISVRLQKGASRALNAPEFSHAVVHSSNPHALSARAVRTTVRLHLARASRCAARWAHLQSC